MQPGPDTFEQYFLASRLFFGIRNAVGWGLATERLLSEAGKADRVDGWAARQAAYWTAQAEQVGLGSKPRLLRLKEALSVGDLEGALAPVLERIETLETQLAKIPAGDKRAISFLEGSFAVHSGAVSALLFFDPARWSPEFTSSIIGSLSDHDPTPRHRTAAAAIWWHVAHTLSPASNLADRDDWRSAVRDDLLTAYMEWQWRSERTSPEELDVALLLWACSFARSLATELAPEIEQLLPLAKSRQRHYGSWISLLWDKERRQPVPIPSALTTALFLLVFHTLGDDRYSDAIDKGRRWLLANVRPDGGWFKHSWHAEFNFDSAADPFSTLIVLEALQRTNDDESLAAAVSSSETWLIQSQDNLGSWDSDIASREFVSYLFVRYLQMKGRREVVHGYLRMAKDFLLRAETISVGAGLNGRREAMILTSHALEMFLYGLFQHPTVDLDFYRSNGRETVGLREALAIFERYLKDSGALEPSKPVFHRTGIMDIAGRRDEVIHRAGDVDEKSLRIGLEKAREFMRRYSENVLQNYAFS